MAGMAKPATEIKVFDGKIHLYTFAMGLFKREDAFALNEEFEREHQGVKSNVSGKDIYSQLQLRWQKHTSKFSYTFLWMETTFVTSCLLLWTSKPFQNEVYSGLGK